VEFDPLVAVRPGVREGDDRGAEVRVEVARDIRERDPLGKFGGRDPLEKLPGGSATEVRGQAEQEDPIRPLSQFFSRAFTSSRVKRERAKAQSTTRSSAATGS